MCVYGKYGLVHDIRTASPLCSAGLKRKPLALIKRLRKAKKEAPAMEKPACVKTHLRNMIIVPEMIGSVVGIHQGKTFNQVEIKVGCGCCMITPCMELYPSAG